MEQIFEMQKQFQKTVTGELVPCDSVRWFQYHMTAMTEELGEVLKADKRWKTHRNAYYDKEEKDEELVDVFITALNLVLFSDLECEPFLDSVMAKIIENYKKYQDGKDKEKNDLHNRGIEQSRQEHIDSSIEKEIPEYLHYQQSY